MRNLSTEYPGKIIVDGNNPDGTFKNETTPDVTNDGTPNDNKWAQDLWGWPAHLLNKVGVAPDGVQENEATSQIYNAIQTAVRNLFLIWDAGNTYIKGALVVGSDDNCYKSLVAANLNNDPTSSPSEWLQIGTLATTTMAGLVELATTAENAAGTSNLVVPTALGIREAFNATGSAPVFACRAWVNFDGTPPGPTILASGNVTSITDNGIGDYTINFTTALPDSNYSIGHLLIDSGVASSIGLIAQTTTTCQIICGTWTGGSTFADFDPDITTLSFFR